MDEIFESRDRKMHELRHRRSSWFTCFRRCASDRRFIVVYPPDGVKPPYQPWNWLREPNEWRWYWRASLQAAFANMAARKYVAFVCEVPKEELEKVVLRNAALKAEIQEKRDAVEKVFDLAFEEAYKKIEEAYKRIVDKK